MIAWLALAALAWQPPLEVHRLANGLTVLISEDHSSPTFGLCVSYRIGHRLEPRGKSGFAHLFEHMMFEGTPESPKGTMDRVIEAGGGTVNATTRADDTTYVATAPVSALDAMLWLEADRMRTLDFSEKNLANQRDVVKEEIRENVANQPYGQFYATDLYQLAFDRWASKHDGYGSFVDLDAAHARDVAAFYRRYYGPENAVLAIVGDVDARAVLMQVHKYFDAIARRSTPRPPDVAEKLGRAPRALVQHDKLAKVPAVAIGWRMPSRGHADQMALAVLSELLVGGEASRLYLSLVRKKKLLSRVEGGIGWPFNAAFDWDGPTLFTVFGPYKKDAQSVVSAIDDELARLVKDGVSDEELARAKTKMRADFYSGLEPFMERATQLAVAQQVWGDPRAYLALPDRVSAVTSDDLRRVTAKYLTAANRSMIDRQGRAIIDRQVVR